MLRKAGASTADVLLIAALLIAGIASPWFLPARTAAGDLELSTPNESIRISLAEDQVIQVDGKYGPTVIEVKGGRARIVRSTCPDNHRHSVEGWAKRSGETLICLPNQVVLTLGGTSFDSVVR